MVIQWKVQLILSFFLIFFYLLYPHILLHKDETKTVPTRRKVQDPIDPQGLDFLESFQKLSTKDISTSSTSSKSAKEQPVLKSQLDSYSNSYSNSSSSSNSNSNLQLSMEKEAFKPKSVPTIHDYAEPLPPKSSKWNEKQYDPKWRKIRLQKQPDNSIIVPMKAPRQRLSASIENQSISISQEMKDIYALMNEASEDLTEEVPNLDRLNCKLMSHQLKGVSWMQGISPTLIIVIKSLCFPFHFRLFAVSIYSVSGFLISLLEKEKSSNAGG